MVAKSRTTKRMVFQPNHEMFTIHQLVDAATIGTTGRSNGFPGCDVF
jgi:hypothetical protein